MRECFRTHNHFCDEVEDNLPINTYIHPDPQSLNFHSVDAEPRSPFFDRKRLPDRPPSGGRERLELLELLARRLRDKRCHRFSTWHPAFCVAFLTYVRKEKLRLQVLKTGTNYNGGIQQSTRGKRSGEVADEIWVSIGLSLVYFLMYSI